MGKASKWFRGFFGLNKKPPDPTHSSSTQPNRSPNPAHKPSKKKWSFVRSYKEKPHLLNQRYSLNLPSESPHHNGGRENDVDPNKHAIAVAAATAAVAEAAVAAAQAAAAVVKLTSSGRASTTATPTTSGVSGNAGAFSSGGGDVSEVSSTAQVRGSGVGYGSREQWAAVKIQSYFRAYLSRRALRALKGLVKLQALVRGHIARKRTANILQRVQERVHALLRVQARARLGRSLIYDSPHLISKYTHQDPITPEKFEDVIRARGAKYDGSSMLKRNRSKSNGNVLNEPVRAHSVRSGPVDDERSDKILEIDPGKHGTTPRRKILFHSSHLSLGSDQYSQNFTTSRESTARQTVPTPSSYEVHSFGPLQFADDLDDGCYCTADGSPQFYSASSKGGSSKVGPCTPAKSDVSRSCISNYSDHPNYMSCTESSKAKVRSVSAPKQRPQYERVNSTKKYSIPANNDSRFSTEKVSAMHASFTGKAYPGSGRLDRLGMPIREDYVGFSGGHWHRV